MGRPTLALFAAALVAGLCSTTMAQQAASLQRIAFFGPAPPASAPATAPSLLSVFRAALAELGLVEGRDVIIDSRWPEGDRLDRLPEVAAELVSLRPDVIFGVGATAARAAAGATKTTPIVYAVVVDPVATGLTTQPERPEANLTGVTTYDPQFATTQLALLKELLPGLTRVALLGDAGAAPPLFQSVEVAARATGLDAKTYKVERSASPDFQGALDAAKADGVGAVVVISTPVTTPHRKAIVAHASGHRLPTLSPRDHEDAAPLLSYGTTFTESTRRAAGYVGKILKGAKPGDLPVQTVSQPELIVNLATARTLGINVPANILEKATRVVRE